MLIQDSSIPHLAGSKRVSSIDSVRGVVMILMALDHVRDLLHISSLTQSPTDLTTTTPILFFFRWITYLCAPTFVFLSGASVWLSSQRSGEKHPKRRFLIKRGIWLILLEFTVVNFALWFDVQFRLLMLQVIAAIGAGFIVLAALLRVSPRAIGLMSTVILATHTLLSFVPASDSTLVNAIRNFLFMPGALQLSSGFTLFVAYPLVPWIAIMLLGYSLGGVFEKSRTGQNQLLLKIGTGFLACFTVLRFLNRYGDPIPWKVERDSLFTFLSFLNVTKYTPSLNFVFLFLGTMCLLLRFSGQWPRTVQQVLSVYGRVPLFYYLLHLYFIRVSVFVMVFAQGYHWSDLQFGPFQFGCPVAESGLALPGVLLVWILLVVLLYPLCQSYDHYKKANASVWWVRYL